MRLPEDSNCSVTDYLQPTALPDGRLGLVRFCPSASDPADDRTELVVYDLERGALDPDVRVQLPFLTTQFSWNPQVNRGIANASNQICATLVWVTPTDAEYAQIDLRDGDQTHRIDRGLVETGRPDCDGEARADWPAWSPDGGRIALFFSPPAVGVSGHARLDAPWDLYLMDPEAQEPEKHLGGVLHPRSPAWSPDGRWLAFSGEMGELGPGTWRYEPVTGNLTRVTTDSLDWLAWSPDGNRMVGVVTPQPIAPYDQRLVLLDLSRLE